MADGSHALSQKVEVGWRPQPGPQHAFVTCPIDEVVYGGARGGGKTDGVLGDWLLHSQRYGENAKGLLIRRTRIALEPTIARAKVIFQAHGAEWLESKSCFVMPGGGVLYCRYLDKDADAAHYQGHDYTRVYVEELTQFANPAPLKMLMATLRSAAGVPCGYRASCNPGGPGHNWVKARYIDLGPFTVASETFKNPFDGTDVTMKRVFIPARLKDNPMLLHSDPGYVGRLYMVGSAALVKAWLDGDWNVIDGAFFDGWSNRNIVNPFPIPQLWTKFRSFDWGSAKPFSVGWWAVVTDSHRLSDGVVLPRGALVRYREWYGMAPNEPNVGLKMTAEAVGAGIREREAKDVLTNGQLGGLPGVADPSIFRNDGGPSIGERMAKAGAVFRPADNTRVGINGAMGGWDQLRARIRGFPEVGPMLYVFSTCKDTIRTLPVLQHDKTRPEDLDTEGEDHAADEIRYACMSRPMRAVAPRPNPNPRDLWGRPSQPADNWKTA